MRFTIATLLLIAGCAAPSGSRFLYVDSDSYCCGAAEGLGCGLAIAPVLEQIDEVDGVAESATSWDGRQFRIELQHGADPDQVAQAAQRIMEGDATCTVEPRGKAAAGRPDRWYNAEQTLELSRHEAGVIASDFAAKIEAEVPLDPAVAERLHVIIREELERAFEQAHDEGGGVWRLQEQAASVMPRFEARIAELLTPDQARQVAAIIARERGG